MSPPTQNNNIYSPNKEGYNSRKLSYNFNFSPSAIFNTVNTNQNDININIDNPQTLQEKLEPFVKKGDTNNFIFNRRFLKKFDIIIIWNICCFILILNF